MTKFRVADFGQSQGPVLDDFGNEIKPGDKCSVLPGETLLLYGRLICNEGPKTIYVWYDKDQSLGVKVEERQV